MVSEVVLDENIVGRIVPDPVFVVRDKEEAERVRGERWGWDIYICGDAQDTHIIDRKSLVAEGRAQLFYGDGRSL